MVLEIHSNKQANYGNHAFNRRKILCAIFDMFSNEMDSKRKSDISTQQIFVVVWFAGYVNLNKYWLVAL